MKRNLVLSLVLFLFILPVVSLCLAADNDPCYVADHLLVRFQNEGTTTADDTAREAIVQAAGGGTIEKMYSVVPGLALITLPEGTTVPQAEAAFSSTTGVRYVARDDVYEFFDVPDDPLFPRLWGLNNTGQTGGTEDADIDAVEAWDLSTGSQDIIVAICDSGLDYTHIDLAANMWTNEAELNGVAGVDDDNNGYIDDIYGFDFAFGDGEPDDNVGHGTHVAGTVGAVGNNGEGVCGVNWTAQLMACKIGDTYGIFTSDAIEGIQYAIDNGAHVMNHSWGGYTYNPALYEAIIASQEAGLLFVAAAGNSGINNDVLPMYPASYDLDSIVSVMATNEIDVKANFSNWGSTTVDLGAPGVDIYSTIPGDGYDSYSGTSMASPHVAGAAALVLSVDPSLSYSAVKEILMSTVDPLSSLTSLSVTEGRMDVHAALLAVQGEGYAPVPDPMEWDVEPVAVGEQTIFMKAVKARHPSGVQYYFDCETDLNNFAPDPNVGQDWYGNTKFDSGDPSDPNGWVSDPLYYRGDYEDGTEYYFRVRARSKDEGLETEWSDIIGPVVSGSGLPPYPNPAQWDGTPRKVSNRRIAMEATTGYGRAVLDNGQWVSTPIHYYFDCVDTDDPMFPDANDLDSWDASAGHDSLDPFYQRTVSAIPTNPPGYYYDFNVWAVADNGVATTVDPNNLKSAYMAPPPITRDVPSASYQTIQDAIDASYNGDTVLVHRGVYREVNIDFKGKAITVKSENPEDPAIVAATVIDCEELPLDTTGYGHETRRAFLFQNMEGRDSVLAGITIRNATAFDEADSPISGIRHGDPDQGDRYTGAEMMDGEDALGGAILIGEYDIEYDIIFDPITGDFIFEEHVVTSPSSPTIRNCVFQDCAANGEYGPLVTDPGSQPNDTDGTHGSRGLNGGNAYGGAIYAVSGSAPLLKECQFINCQAVGGDGSDGANGNSGGGHSDGVEDADGWRGGDGGDGGLGGCAWGGAIYFESGCRPDLYDVTVSNCFVQVGQPGVGGNGGNGSGAEGTGRGGHGGNGGLGGDLRAPDSSGGAIYFGENTVATIDGCRFENCRVIAELTGDYSGGNGGHGGGASGDGQAGGNGGHGGSAYFVPDKMFEIGGATATGGTGGDGGGGSNGGPRGNCGNGGLRNGTYGAPCGGTRVDSGIFPSNMYYMAYYWEDTTNSENLPVDPNDYINLAYAYQWEWETDEGIATVPINYYTDPNDPNTFIDTYDRRSDLTTYMIATDFSPFHAIVGMIETYDPNVTAVTDPNTGQISLNVDWENSTLISTATEIITPLTPTNPDQPNAGACAGANFYGENSVVVMKDTIVSANNSFANHGGGELYDKGCDVQFENCTFESNQTWYSGETSTETTDYVYEGFGGAIFADQPVRFTFDECDFDNNNAYSGGAIYCNFAPSDPNSQLDPTDPNYVAPSRFNLTECTFSGNRANYHFMYSYGGAVYVGNSLDPYEEYYFNKAFTTASFVTVFYWNDHGYADFTNRWTLFETTLWDDELEVDRILGSRGQKSPVNQVSVSECLFEENLAPYGGGLYMDACVADIVESQFTENMAEIGAGGFMFAGDMFVKDNVFHGNIGTEIESLGLQSQDDDSTVETLCNGGGLYVSDSNLNLINNHFTGNAVDGFAGALFVNGPSLDWYPQNVINNVFAENSAGLQGGALVASGVSDVYVQNCSFVDNSVLDDEYGAGGAILAHDAFVDIVNTICWNTEAFYPGAPQGPQIAVGDPYEEVQEHDPEYIPLSTVFVDYSDIQGGEEDIFVADGEGPWLWYSTHNIEDDPATVKVDEADPLFAPISDPMDVTERTFYLSQRDPSGLEPLQEVLFDPGENNPCVNAGIGSITVADLSDLLGFDATTRTDHGLDADALDIGYHHDASQEVEEYVLTTQVYIADLFPHGILEVTTEPNNLVGHAPDSESYAVYRFKQGTVVQLLATPVENYRVAQWQGADSGLYYYDLDNTITMTGFEYVQVEFELGVPKNLYVPETYVTLEDALEASRSGDTIVLAPQVGQSYTISNPDGINFGLDRNGDPKQLVITSTDPNNPLIVARTVIDCQGSRYLSKRAFHFDSGQGPDSRIEGITIRNAFVAEIGASAAIYTGLWPIWTGTGEPWYTGEPITAWTVDTDPPPSRGFSGEDAFGDSYGGAVLCENGSSPTFYKCVFENCTAAGGIGGDGADGSPPPGLRGVTAEIDSQSGGHSGQGIGNGYGGAIAIISGSNPKINQCTFKNNRATGGWGGIPGDAGGSYNDGRYGWGGNDPAGLWYANEYYDYNLEAGRGEGDGHGGAIYVEADCDPAIDQCKFIDNIARTGYVSPGGAEQGGDSYPAPFDPETVGAWIKWGEADARNGRHGQLTDFGTIAGGAVYYEEDAEDILTECAFTSSYAADIDIQGGLGFYSPPGIITFVEDFAYTRGGAVYIDPNAVLLLDDCIFKDNQAGAVYSSTGAFLKVKGNNFINNASYDPNDPTTASDVTYDLGGAITVAVDALEAAQISDCNFIGNQSNVGGGAIRADSHIEVSDSMFTGNQSMSNGGAIFADYYTNPIPHTIQLKFTNCEFSGNESEGLGGAAYTRNAILELNDSFLVHNKAFSGGGIYADATDLEMQGTLVYGNEATGLILGKHRSVADEGFGGGLLIVDCSAAITDTRIQNNISRSINGSGGGLCIKGGQSYKDLSLRNCLISGNMTENTGGALSCMINASVDLHNCTIADNMIADDIVEEVLAGGIFVDYSSAVSLFNSIVSGNDGYGIYEELSGDGSATSVSMAANTLFYGNTVADLYDCQTRQNVSGESGLESLPNPGYTDILDDDPLFTDGPLNGYYLNQQSPQSPAVDAGSDTPKAVGLYDESRTFRYTTDPTYPTIPNDPAVLEDGGSDGESDPVDLGYHFYIPNPKTDRYALTALIDNGAGQIQVLKKVQQDDELVDEWDDFVNPQLYYRGKVVDLKAVLDDTYFLLGWSGGTIDDSSEEAENVVLMTRPKDIEVLVRLRKTLNVGTSSEYDTLGDALDDAQDGDVIVIAPGQYTAASQFGSLVNNIELDNKVVTITGSNPDDETVVRATVFRDFDFDLANLEDYRTIIEGITLEESRMDMLEASPIIRNCVFRECRFTDAQLFHVDPDPGTDGYSQYPVIGGAMRLFESSPKIINCIFENNAVFGVDGEDGVAGAASHPDGGDGGWPSPTYGGAVYCGLSSSPEFVGCTFTENEVFGANGGNGADYITIDGAIYWGGRGGGWLFDEFNEQYLIDVADWNGWVYKAQENKYLNNFYSLYLAYLSDSDGVITQTFLEDYEFDIWAKWFNWSDAYTNWDDFWANYSDDPYDALLDEWRYCAYGGAVYCEFNSDATFKDCVFEDNQSHGGLAGVGGAQFATSAWPDRQLNMPNGGGAVFAASDCDLVFDNCTFRNNTADISTVDLPHTFQTSFGGAVAYRLDCTAKFTDCIVTENTATVGGGIYGLESNLEVTGSKISSNNAYIGAGLYSYDDQALISDSLFASNRAETMTVVETSDDEEDDQQQDEDEIVVPVATLDLTGEGAGLFAYALDLDIRDTTFIGNIAGISGGGINIGGKTMDGLNVFNCLFVENSAGRDGGGASINRVNGAKFGNCTFAKNFGQGIFREVETGEYEQVFDDNGDPVLDDENNPVYIPITIQVQDFPSSGGGLAISYDSVVDVNDSIFWANGADQGTGIYVGAGSEYPSESPPQSSELTISYSVVADYPSVSSIYVEPGSTLTEGVSVISSNPEFVELPSATDGTGDYYLDQEISPCVNTGSGFASELGLSNYTTSITGALDKGFVDIGFHYKQAEKAFCGLADLVLSGMVDLPDLAFFMAEWLSGPCDNENTWCNGADLNTDTLVNIEDFSGFVSCWLEEDDEAPSPDPAEWELEPNAVPETFGTIEMAAVVHHDKWWPDEYIKYRFYKELAATDELTVFYVDEDRLEGNNDGWLTYDELGPKSKDEIGNLVQIYATKTELDPNTISLYVEAVDGYGNKTALSDRKSVAPGGTDLPDAYWLSPPFVRDDQFAIQMEAVAYEDFLAELQIDPPDLPDGYVIMYQFDFRDTAPNGNDRDFGLSPIWVDDGMVEGQTYSYRVRMGLFYENADGSFTPIDGAVSTWSPEASVVAVLPDLIPPTPNPAEHDESRISPFAQSHEGKYYHYVIAVEAEDESDVEYKFVCIGDSTLTSGKTGNGPEWRNADNVGAGADAAPEDVNYPTDTGGDVQVPYEYRVRTNLKYANYRWFIITRDQTLPKNTTWHLAYQGSEANLPDPSNPEYQTILDAVNAQVKEIQN